MAHQSTTGEQFEAEFLVGAVGQLNRPAYQNLKALKTSKVRHFTQHVGTMTMT